MRDSRDLYRVVPWIITHNGLRVARAISKEVAEEIVRAMGKGWATHRVMKHEAKPCVVNGKLYPSMSAAARANGVHHGTIREALRFGWEDRVGSKKGKTNGNISGGV